MKISKQSFEVQSILLVGTLVRTARLGILHQPICKFFSSELHLIYAPSLLEESTREVRGSV